LNQHSMCLGQRSFSSKVIVRINRQTNTYNGPIALPAPLQWSVKLQDRQLQIMTKKTSSVVFCKLSKPPSVTITATCGTLSRAPRGTVNRSVLSRCRAADVLVRPPTKFSAVTVVEIAELKITNQTHRQSFAADDLLNQA